MYLTREENGIVALILLGISLSIGHLVLYLLSKGIIWVLFELFQVNLYGKFWAVYVALVILNVLFRGKVIKIKRS